MVRVDHLDLKAGIYALTGANGSGKSTLFRVLMACETNDRPIDLPPSIFLHTPFEPIIEEDDLQREIACEEADKAGAGFMVHILDTPDASFQSMATLQAVRDYIEQVYKVYGERDGAPMRPYSTMMQ